MDIFAGLKTKKMFRQKIQDLQSEMINLIAQKVSFLIEDKDSRLNLPTSFRLDRLVNGYDDAYDTESLSICSLGYHNNKVCLISQEEDYINLGSCDVYNLAWVLDQLISGSVKLESNQYPF